MGLFKAAGRSEQAFEALEPRLALYQNPMIASPPPFASMETFTDSVVRVDTNVGFFDLELFDALAPVTVNNFLSMVRNGRLDESIFHALLPGLLYGGLAKFNDVGGLSYIPLQAPIPNGFSRSNLAGTIAMVPTTSTTVRNTFLINLTDHPNLNTQNGGFTVFGKVIQGMSVLQTIAGFATQDFNTLFNTPAGPFSKVPVTPAYSGTPTEATLVRITDIEIIKIKNSNKFYEQSFVYPEGFRNSSTIERIDLVNMEPGFTNLYQIIVHYETGDRDSVIAWGTLGFNQRASIKINDMNIPSLNLVRSGVPYSFEVRSTRAMGVSIDRRQDSTTIGEEFLMEARMTVAQLQAWNLGDVVKSATDQSSIIYENLSDHPVNVYMLLFPEGGGSQIFLSRTLAPYRRGTIALSTLGGVPNAHYSVQISTTGPIIAAATHYKVGGGGAFSDGSTGMATSAGGRVEGYLAAAMVPTGGESHIDVMFSAGSPSAIFVDFVFTLSDGSTVLSSTLLTLAVRKQRIDLSTIPGLPVDELFSVHYTSRNGVTPVTASYSAEFDGDEMSTPFQTMATKTVMFADGYTDPTLTSAQQDEVISVFNPYARQQVSFFYQLLYHFPNGDTVYAPFGGPLGLGPRQRADHFTRDFPEVMAKINSNPAFRFYSVEVISVELVLPIVNGGVVAQLTQMHTSWNQNMTTGPGLDPRVPVTFLDNPEYH
jgi:cyclophilin family peptidyl-prolyl cis-trans isomerase